MQRKKKELEKIVGKDYVLDDPPALGEYAGDKSFVLGVRPAFVVKPASAKEIQALIKWAKENETTLVPVSSAGPHYHGDTVPRVGGAVIVDMTRMKKIFTVHQPNQVAIMEPGVTYEELIAELDKQGLIPFMPLCPKPGKSVIVSACEREPITLPARHWDVQDPFLCCEVYFGTGDMYQTGEAAGADDTLEDMQKWGNYAMSPWALGQWEETRMLNGAQGTMGIMSWASVKVRPKPKSAKTFFIPCDELQPLIDLSYELLRVREGDQIIILNDVNLAALVGKDAAGIEALRKQLPPYTLIVTIEGVDRLPEKRIEWQEGDLREFAQTRVSKPLDVLYALPGITGADFFNIVNAPSKDVYWKEKYTGAFHDLFFHTTLDKTPEFIETVSAVAKAKRFADTNIGIYIQPIVQGTSCHIEFDFYYEEGDDAVIKEIDADALIKVLNQGAFFSRPYGAWVKPVFNRALDTVTMQRKLKKIFDPANILNTGQLAFYDN